MSLPTSQSAFGSARRMRAPSVSSHSSPRLIPGSSEHSGDGASDLNYGSFRGRPDTQASQVSALNAATASGHREPTRSSVHLSYRGGPPTHVDNAFTARSVREDTAELASYALSDRASGRSVSPPRQRPAQTSIESYFNLGADEERSPVRNAEGLHNHIIEEVSEPVSPESSPSSVKAPGASALTDMLKRSPPNTPPKSSEDDGEAEALDGNRDEESPRQRRLVLTSNGLENAPTERTSLLGKDTRFETHPHPDWIRGEQDIERQEVKRGPAWPKLRNVVLWPREKGLHVARTIVDPREWDGKAIWQQAVKEPVAAFPAAVLGALLNILDALSYGMILFPLGQPIFEKLGAAGISMFYVSCIVSQMVYSCGGSKFRGGVGSEMIEVVPFFHKMAFTILATVGEENPDSVIATTIVSYALSSVLTGVIFFLMGSCGFGYIVGFIPRHILIGCIGGVGVFLLMTGLEVCAGLSGNLNFDIATLQKLFELNTFILWIIPLILAIILFTVQHRVTSKYLLPIYILCIPAVFYFFVFSTDQLEPENLRENGWIFEGPAAGEPWWYFYTLYNFKLVHWGAVAETIPSMLALTFFGVLHVPINVPSLGFKLGIDDIDLDRELMAHGVSNALSGFAGSIQNYLVYSNSILFINSGGDSRLAGVMLAALTAVVMVIGPVIIGYIPTMMVGTLIFVLGLDLTTEALWLPRKKLKTLEYFTVVVIVVVMGTYDFVVGIAVGVGLAFISLIFQTSTVPAVRASYSGEVAGSTVRRNPTQYRYLRDVGAQIHVTKLAGYLFFGTIVSVEDRIKGLIEDEAFHQRPIRFLIFDLAHVTGIDYSAAEAFNRLSRILGLKGITLLMSGVRDESEIGQGLRATGVGDGENEVKMFEDLNSALESCENELLKTLYASKDARATRNAPTPHLDAPVRPRSASHTFDTQFSSPRRNQLHRAATTTLDDTPGDSRYLNFKEPLRLILQTFQGLTDKNEDFWFQSLPFFVKKEYAAGTTLYKRGEQAKGFYLLEDGILRADYELPQGRYFESIVAGTTCGELPFFSETDRTATVQAERDCVAWLMDSDSWEKLQTTEPAVAQELLRISLKLTSERMSAITSYVLTTAG
ncbi:sulfate transporter family protein-like protein [Leptodontidium sp. MPI-SDFR-AT-0119]|nr:sulfate transporter family protein-like protein [Leptodontidium sp. MPI-SDFR-AT-0119]